jgi:hypothetical protein
MRTGFSSRLLNPVLACLGTVFLTAVLQAPARAGEPSPLIECIVAAEANGSATVIHGRIFANREVFGRYELTASSKASGSSNVTQSGDFRAAPGNPAGVGTITLGGPGVVTAVLSASVSGQVVSCRLE